MEKSTELINNKQRVVATFNIQFNGAPARIKIKKLNFGEFNDVQRSSSKVTMMGGTPKLEMDSVAMNENAMIKSILEAPFQVTSDEIRSLDREVAEEILENINELNSPSEKKKEI